MPPSATRSCALGSLPPAPPGARATRGSVAARASRRSIATRRTAVAERSAPTVLLAVEQLRRRVPGGIGVYARGLLSGLAADSAADDQVGVAVLASRSPGGAGSDPLAALGGPAITSRLPGRLLTVA